MKAAHHGTYRGRNCKVTLKNGDEFIDKFTDSKGTRWQFKERGWINKNDIKNFQPFGFSMGSELPKILSLKARERVSIAPIEKPTTPVPALVSQDAPESFRGPEPPPSQRLVTVPLHAFVNQLPDGNSVMTLYITSAIELVRVKNLLGLQTVEGMKAVSEESKQVRGPRQVTHSLPCDFCGEWTPRRSNKKTAVVKCKKTECVNAYNRQYMRTYMQKRRALDSTKEVEESKVTNS